MPIGRMPKTVDVTRALEWSTPGRTDLNVGVSVVDSTVDLSLTDLSNDPLSGLSEYFDADINPTDYGFGGDFDFLVEGEQRRNLFATDSDRLPVEGDSLPSANLNAEDDSVPIQMASSDVSKLVEQSVNLSPDVRIFTLASLGRVAQFDNEDQFFSAIMARLSDPVASVRFAALQALAEVVMRDRTAADVASAPKDADPESRMENAFVLNERYRLSNSVLDDLQVLMMDSNLAIVVMAERARDLIRRYQNGLDRVLGGVVSEEEFSLLLFLARQDFSDETASARMIQIMTTSDSPAVRRAAAKIMPEFHENETVVLALMGATTDPDAKVRQAAISSLSAIEDFGDEIDISIAMGNTLADPDANVRLTAAEACLMTNDPDNLLEVLGGLTVVPDFGIKIRAIGLIVDMIIYSDIAVEVLRGKNVVNSNSPAIRYAAAANRSRIKALKLISACLADENKAVRDAAAEALRKLEAVSKSNNINSIRDDSPEARALLAGALKDADPEVRRSAADVVGKLKITEESFLMQLATLLNDNDPAVRTYAARSLGSLGISSETIVERLRERLLDPVSEVRENALSALLLLNVSDSSTVSVVRGMFFSMQYFSAQELGGIILAIERFGLNDTEVTRKLIDLLGVNDPAVSEPAGHALKMLGIFVNGPGGGTIASDDEAQ